MLTGAIPVSAADAAPLAAGLALANPLFEEWLTSLQANTETIAVVERDMTLPLAQPDRITPAGIGNWKRQVLARPMQALLIERQGQRLRLERNMQATCPLYMAMENGVLYLHWDPVQLRGCLKQPLKLDRQRCINFIDGQIDYDCHTVFEGIYCLPERGVAEITTSGIRLIPPPNILPPKPLPLVDGADPIGMLLQLLHQAIARWPLQQGRVACELSSGLDSTLVAHVLSGQLGYGTLHTRGFAAQGLKADYINARRHETVQLLGSHDRLLPALGFNALQLTIPPQRRWYLESQIGFWPDDLQALAQSGIGIAFTGFGGDELCAPSLHEHESEGPAHRFTYAKQTGNDTVPSLLTTGAAAEKKDLITWPEGMVSTSTHRTTQNAALPYMRHGLWCAHPLAQAEIQTFAHFLPTEWRRDRRLSREVLLRLGRSPEFVRQEIPESLAFAVSSLADPHVPGLFSPDAVLVREGLINPAKVRQAHQMLLHQPDNTHALFRLLTATLLEVSLRGW